MDHMSNPMLNNKDGLLNKAEQAVQRHQLNITSQASLYAEHECSIAHSAVLEVQQRVQAVVHDNTQRLQEQAQQEIRCSNQVLQESGMMIAELCSSEQPHRSHAEFLAQESRQLETELASERRQNASAASADLTNLPCAIQQPPAPSTPGKRPKPRHHSTQDFGQSGAPRAYLEPRALRGITGITEIPQSDQDMTSQARLSSR
eukprot:5009746-Amphidinium_carterae.2